MLFCVTLITDNVAAHGAKTDRLIEGKTYCDNITAKTVKTVRLISGKTRCGISRFEIQR